MRGLIVFILGSALFAQAAWAGFRFRLRDDLGTLDWGYGEVNHQVVQQLMEGLVVAGPQGEPLPALAESWRSQNGGRTHVFKLRAGMRWSDGEPVCASQFVDAWLRVLDPDTASPYAHYLFDLRNARAFHQGKVADRAKVGVASKGCRELVVQLEQAVASFPVLASHWVLNPIRLDLIKKFGTKWMEPRNLAVTGPYRLEGWERDKRYVLKANPFYHGKRAGEERIEAVVINDDSTALSLFRQGALDWSGDLPFIEKPKLAASPEYREYPSFVSYHLGFSVSASFASQGLSRPLSRNERCALALALDKREIPLLLKGGETPAAQMLPPGLDIPKKKVIFDPSRARALWGEGPRELEVHYYAKDSHDATLQWVQAQWLKHLDVRAKLVRMEGKAYWSSLQRRAPPVFLSGITAAYAHPYSVLSEFLSESPANWGRFSSHRYDQLAKATLQLAAGSRKLASLVNEAQELLVERECAIVPLYFRKTTALLKQGWSGFFINPMTYVYLKDVKH